MIEIKRDLILKNLKKSLKIILGLAKSFISAVFGIAWGIAGLFIMMGAITYMRLNYEIDTSYISPIFIDVTTWFVHNIIYIFYVYWVFYFIIEYKELKNKEEEKVENDN